MTWIDSLAHFVTLNREAARQLQLFIAIVLVAVVGGSMRLKTAGLITVFLVALGVLELLRILLIRRNDGAK